MASSSRNDQRRNYLRDDQSGPRTVAANLSAAGRDRGGDSGLDPSPDGFEAKIVE